MAKNVICFHSGCSDGFGAAWASWLKFKESAVYIPCSYASPPPRFNGDTENIYIFDFSFDKSLILEWKKLYNVELWDHHISAKEKLEGVPGCHFDMTHSGAFLAFKRFFPNSDLPTLIEYVQDRDLFTNSLYRTEEITLLLNSYPQDFQTWTGLSIDFAIKGIDALADQGAHIKRYVTAQIANTMKESKVRKLNIAGYVVPVINTQMWQSEIANALCTEYNSPFAACYFDRADGKRQWSLRSVSDFSVAKIAEKFGGGGHPRAAGMETDIQEKDING